MIGRQGLWRRTRVMHTERSVGRYVVFACLILQEQNTMTVDNQRVYGTCGVPCVSQPSDAHSSDRDEDAKSAYS